MDADIALHTPKGVPLREIYTCCGGVRSFARSKVAVFSKTRSTLG